jgi:hypothetical protein
MEIAVAVIMKEHQPSCLTLPHVDDRGCEESMTIV